MKKINILYYIALCQGLFKGYLIILMLLLPILYVEKTIPISYIGYLGSINAFGVLLGSIIVNIFGNRFRKIDFINFSSLITFLLLVSFIFFKNNYFLFLLYTIVGLGYGISSPFFQAFKGEHTTKETRIKIFGYLDIISDFFKVVHPVIATLIYAKFGTDSLIYFLVATGILYLILLYLFEIHEEHKHEKLSGIEVISFNFKLINNKRFNLFLFLEFLDSVASQALFVFIPTLFLFKNFTIENALIFQAVVFFGYISGRVFVAFLSDKFGVKNSLILSFIGQALTVLLLVVIPAHAVLYFLCYLLGIFARGTTPVINGSAYNEISDNDFKRGATLYGISGSIGDIFSQFFMGLALAYLGPQYPFYFSIIICVMIILVIQKYLRN